VDSDKVRSSGGITVIKGLRKLNAVSQGESPLVTYLDFEDVH